MTLTDSERRKFAEWLTEEIDGANLLIHFSEKIETAQNIQADILSYIRVRDRLIGGEKVEVKG